jgi:hypothetical protein
MRKARDAKIAESKKSRGQFSEAFGSSSVKNVENLSNPLQNQFLEYSDGLAKQQTMDSNK